MEVSSIVPKRVKEYIDGVWEYSWKTEEVRGFAFDWPQYPKIIQVSNHDVYIIGGVEVSEENYRNTSTCF